MRSLRLALLFGAIIVAACSSNDGTDIGPSPGPGDDEDGGTGPTVPGRDGGTPGSDGDAGPVLPAPLDLKDIADDTWTWFEIPGATCRDGSATGFALNLRRAAKKTMIYLEGGGACFNELTCSNNPSTVARKQGGDAGIFDRSRAENPVAEWNHVYVPYCTGDVHAGNNPDGNVEGVGPQKFVGYANMTLFLGKLAATFPTTERVLLTGMSAGGFGSAANYGQTVRYFPNIPVNLVDDAGPAMPEPPLAQCLQDYWKGLWKLDTTVGAACGEDCAGDDFLLSSVKHWAKAKPDYAQGLISSTEDATIRGFFGFGASNCEGFSLVSGAAFTAGLASIRSANASSPNFGTYIYDDTQHTIIWTNDFYSTTLGDKSIAAWVKDIVESDAITNVGP